tara:strand:- start:6121 stop:7023 length:903 start_codon:yes stop_codon:yes gene_type:complete
MKILLVANKTYRGLPDSLCWYFYEPLKKLGHDVYFYDTVAGEQRGFSAVIETYKPDLIFCIMTGSPDIGPHEPWREILNETKSGRTKTFNWFCDDTWRFEKWSSIICPIFTVCSTPEPSHLEKYRQAGYDNIVLGNWHADSECFPKVNFADKPVDLSFIGTPNPYRKSFFDSSDVNVEYFFGLSQEELFQTYSNSKISVNLSINHNDPQRKTQMKQRIFEVPAGRGMLMTQYHKGIEQYFEINKEIFTFQCSKEFSEKIKFLMSKPKIVEKVSSAGYNRFIKEHDSQIRLSNVLDKVMKI